MQLLLVGLVILVVGGVVSLIFSRSAGLSNVLGGASAVVGSVVAMIPAIEVLVSGEATELLSRPWQLPFATFAVQFDPLSAWFAAIILGLAALAAVYGIEYLGHYGGRPGAGASCPGKKSLGASWLFYNLLVATMTLVVSARNGMLFLLAWEGMALSSYFLVVFEDEKKEVRDAGRVYLIASHFGTAFLLAFFVLLGAHAGSLDFAEMAEAGPMSAAKANVLFALAIVGFGVKAGFLPLHVWLPDAHPAAPSHVSAVMSGVMIKTGIYGVVLALSFLGAPRVEWGWTLVGIGATSGVVGVMFALAQHDLKRLLAYHSVENIGIIALGLGVGVLGVSMNEPAMAVLGFAGGLLHVLNHAVFKGLLFLGAGAVLHGAHTSEIDQLGGLMKRMPLVGTTFLIGAVAICGLPPLNGFASEFLIYLGSFEEEVIAGPAKGVPALVVIGSLAAIGGLAASCFAKAFGVVFLGEPRTEHAANAKGPGLMMIGPMLVLAGACFAIGLGASYVIDVVKPALASLTTVAADELDASFDGATGLLTSIAVMACILLGVTVALAIIRGRLLAGRDVGASPTWDCGYAAPAASMQYTSSSFAQPIVEFHSGVLQPVIHLQPPTGLFPQDASLETHTPDVFMRHVYVPLMRTISWLTGKLAWIQHGRLSLYVLYIALALFALLAWHFGISE